MIKDRVGCSKTSSRNLPDSSFVYGLKNEANPEGAGEIISNWVTADPSASKDSVRSHVHSNILAIKHGCVTAKAQRKFAEDHQNIKMKEVINVNMDESSSAYEGPFGRKTEYADENVGSLVRGKYTNFENDDADYPHIDGLVDKGAIPAPKGTKTSIMQADINKRKAAKLAGKSTDSPPKSHFTMKKFQNVPGKLNLPRSSSGNKASN